MNATLLEDISEYIKVDGKIIKVDPKQSYVFLGKERLPEGFIEGSTEELLEKYPGFDETPEGYSVKKMKGAYFFNLGDIKREGSEESVSATYVRKNLIEGNVEALASVLSPQVFEVLTQPENLQAIKRRYQLVEKKKKNLADFKQRFDEQHRMHHPLTKEPLLKKDGTPKLLSKHLITTKTSPKDAERILQYIEKKKALYTKHKGLLEKKWRKTIYSSEHELQFPE
ncbi:MAG: hypothetical protein LBO09_09450 [Candidatus Peribacteria bacterium]|nr:hypothetical protein [Candidatus Peribacteria bacterium]